jgi:hypothetical protein
VRARFVDLGEQSRVAAERIAALEADVAALREELKRLTLDTAERIATLDDAVDALRPADGARPPGSDATPRVASE